MRRNKLQQSKGDEGRGTDLAPGGSTPSSPTSSGVRDADTTSSAPPSSSTAPLSDVLPAREQSRPETAIAEDPFETEASRVLFDAIDEFHSCGAGEYVNIPQLVIVGGQSTGKSSLLQSLTDIPFPVGMNTCTRFATRIVSRRTAPGTPHQVKVTIIAPDFDITDFAMTPSKTYREFVQVKETLTAEEFVEIVQEASTCLGISPGTGTHNKNFAAEVLKVDISGPTRSHFSILDIPGIFSNGLGVKPGEMSGVRNMAIEYLRQPENIVICVADAGTDLMMQEIFELANEYVDKTRLIGVFTKCDRLNKSDSAHVVAISNGHGEDSSKLLHHGWFVVRNRIDGDADGGSDFDLNAIEQSLFNTYPWTGVRADRRGSAKLRRYLGNLLSEKIRKAFPQLQAKLQKLLSETESQLDELGEARTSRHQRRVYLADISRQYEKAAEKALVRPWNLEKVGARAGARVMISRQNDAFGAKMIERGHVYEFEDHNTRDEEYIRRIQKFIYPESEEQQLISDSSQSVSSAAMPQASPFRNGKRQPGSTSDSDAPRSPVRSSDELFERIREEVKTYKCTQLPGFVHPDIIQRLYQVQTRNWYGEAETHLRAVAAVIRTSAQALLGSVVPPAARDTGLGDELLQIVYQLYDSALKKALARLKEYCDGDREYILQTTDTEDFLTRHQLLQTCRWMKSFRLVANAANNPGNSSVVELSLFLYKRYHHSSVENTAIEVHDALKVYYNVSLKSFIRHVINTIVESFVTDPAGPLKGFSTDFVNKLPDDEVDRLGCESREVVEKRQLLDEKVRALRAAQETADSALKKARAILST